MLVTELKKTWRNARISRFSTDTSGVAAMEFAIIAPLLIGVYLGLAELATALNVDRKVSHSASIAGDLATQMPELDNDQIEDIISASLQVANLNSLSGYRLRIESFERLANGNIRSEGVIIYSSNDKGGVPRYDKSNFTEELLPRGTGIVTASVRYRYKPFGFGVTTSSEDSQTLLPNKIIMEETYLLKPRRSPVLVIGDDSTREKIRCTGSPDNVRCSS